MTSKCLFTINVNDFLKPVVRAAFLKAASRWGCDYAEFLHLTHNWPCCCEKMFGPSRLRGYEMLLFLDTDMLVSETSPSPFELCVESETLYTVSGNQLQTLPPEAAEVYRQAVAYPREDLIVKYPKIATVDEFFNGGFFMCRISQAMLDLFELCARTMLGITWPSEEQSIFNLIVHNSSTVQNRNLPRTWNNWVHLSPINTFDPAANINHFGGAAHNLLV